MAKEEAGYDQVGRSGPAAIWPWRMFAFSGFILLVVIIVYFGLRIGYEPFLKNRIEQIDTELENLTATIPQEEQEQFIAFYSQLVNLQTLLKTHPMSSEIFSFLEENTNSRVYYTGLDLDAQDRRLSLDGVAASYDVLVQQLETFGQLETVERYSVTESQVRDNQVRFRLIIFFTPDFF